MGFGDVKLAAVLGGLLGVTGFLVGAPAGGGDRRRRRGGAARPRRFALRPVRSLPGAGRLLAWAFAAPLVDWYLALLGV
jgi:hypothetical protein